jgi:hypothetical protein
MSVSFRQIPTSTFTLPGDIEDVAVVQIGDEEVMFVWRHVPFADRYQKVVDAITTKLIREAQHRPALFANFDYDDARFFAEELAMKAAAKLAVAREGML